MEMFQTVGRPVPRKEGREKVTGESKYVDDLSFPGMLHGATVRSPVAHGRIRGIEFLPGLPWDEFTIVTAKDIPGENCVALIVDDQPYLAGEIVNHPEEPVLLLAHPDKYLVEKARAAVCLDIEPLAAIFTIEESLAQKNIIKRFLVEKGDVASVWADAAHIVEGEYRTGAQEQLYIETNGIIAIANADEGITIWGSMQCPYYVHKALLKAFPLPPEKIRVIQMETGGGFGGKEEYPSMIAGHAALLAWKSGRPVKMIYDRAEDMAATTKRHPSRTYQNRSVARRQTAGHGHRVRNRRRSVRDFVVRRSFPRDDPCGRPIYLSERPHSQHGRGHERTAPRGFSWIWRAAKHLRGGAALEQSSARGGADG
jgi:CO/xanthine dehydrogenase Mo-binding subunit